MADSKENTITLNIDSIAMPFAVVLSVVIFSASFLIGMNNLSNAISDGGGVTIGNSGTDTLGGSGDEIIDPSAIGEVTSTSVNVAGSPTLGDSNAKIALVEFTDYECPFCARFKSETFDQIKESFVDTGDIVFVTENFPLSFHPNAERYANAAECVFDNAGHDAYYSYKNTAFDRIGAGEVLDDETLATIAGDSGANKDDVLNCIENSTQLEVVNADFAKGSAAGINGTPGFVVGVIDSEGNVEGELISGAQPYATFEAAIQAQLDNV